MLIRGDVLFGLSEKEVEERVALGQVNTTTKRSTKTYREIFFKSIFTVFNLVILVMAILVIPTIKHVGDIGNLVFIFVALVNLFIQIFQEIKAKKTIESLTLTVDSKVKILRNLDIVELPQSEIVLDDIIFLEAGSQIPSDAKVVRGDVYVNESMLTGESDDILKKIGSELFSGSYVVSGECYAKVEHVGADNYIEKLSKEATKYSKPKSEIMTSLNKIITTISVILIPLSITLFIIYKSYTKFDGGETVFFGLSKKLVLGLVSSINAMIPYGLFLLTSMSLAASVIKLAKKKTLVQELYCIESLARVDTLCLDKTGTITDGTMRVDDLIIVEKSAQVIEIISSMNASLKGNNQTAKALIKKYGKKGHYEAINILNFNSTNKFSACSFKGIGTFALGAPDVLLTLKKSDPVGKLINEKAKQGNRVIALCKTPSKIKKGTLDGPFTPLALISIHDNLRKGVRETLNEFKENKVDIKIISGDNPVTVSAIAKDAGVEGAENYISLYGMTDEEVAEAATKYTVFGRVKPNQKKLLVVALKAKGRKVAMTGDGVNDILALREADCSIGMGSGSDAIRSVSHLVLINSDFSCLPEVVGEGRKVVNNIERTSALYLAKSIMMFLINIMCITLFFVDKSLEFTSPFKEPSQLLIIENLIIGLPSFVLAFEPNKEPIRGRFITSVIKNAVPVGFVVALNLTGLFFLFSQYENVFDPVTFAGYENNINIIVSTVAFFAVLVFISFPYSKFRMWVSIVSGALILLVPLFTMWTYSRANLNIFKFSLADEYGTLMFDKLSLYVVLTFIGVDLVLYTLMLLPRILKEVKNKRETRRI